MKLMPLAPEDMPSGGSRAADTAGRLTRLLSEPLIHFLVVGALLFGTYHLVNTEPSAAVDTQKIELTNDDVRQLAMTWIAQGRPVPTPAQLHSLVDQRVTEEILVREAVALGLDRDDEIIKRRLAHGWHLVWIDSIELGRVPAFEEVEPDVKSAWLDERYREVKQNALAEMRSRYVVVVPPLDSIDLQDLGGSQAASAGAETLSQ